VSFPARLVDFHADRRGSEVGRVDPRYCQMHIFSRMKFRHTRVSRSTVNMDWDRITVKPCLSKLRPKGSIFRLSRGGKVEHDGLVAGHCRL
jgi:hypothetical protein